jgi:hypothetical protein
MISYKCQHNGHADCSGVARGNVPCECKCHYLPEDYETLIAPQQHDAHVSAARRRVRILIAYYRALFMDREISKGQYLWEAFRLMQTVGRGNRQRPRTSARSRWRRMRAHGKARIIAGF